MLLQPDVTTIADTIALCNLYVMWNCGTYLELEQLSLVTDSVSQPPDRGPVPGREMFSWNLSSYFSKNFSGINIL